MKREEVEALSEGRSGLLLKYFVLKPAGSSPYAIASRAAMDHFAESIRRHDPDLAETLTEWVRVEMGRAIRARKEEP